MDYLLPNVLARALRKPSYRTQLEATIVGTLCFIIISLSTSIFVVFFTELNLFYKIMSGLGGLAIFLILGSQLSTTYIQYYTYKKQMGLYPPDYKLLEKIDEAKDLIIQLNKLIDIGEKDVGKETSNNN